MADKRFEGFDGPVNLDRPTSHPDAETVARLTGTGEKKLDPSAEKANTFILKPAAGRVTVKIKDVTRVTKFGIVLMGEGHETKPTTGEIWELCDEYELDGEDFEPLYKRGDLVIFGKFTGSRVKVGDDVFLILNEKDILGRLIPDNSPEAVEVRKVEVKGAAEAD